MAPVDVCAAVIRRGALILLATRPPGSRLAGRWEFPGGKVSRGESIEACIRREIGEELGLVVLTAEPIDTIEDTGHAPPIRLHFLECTIPADSEPVCHEGQQARWFAADELPALDLLPADRAFLSRQGGRLWTSRGVLRTGT
jgi:8-oxo-dGTP diphosphatase